MPERRVPYTAFAAGGFAGSRFRAKKNSPMNRGAAEERCYLF